MIKEVGWWAEDADVGCIEGVVGLALALLGSGVEGRVDRTGFALVGGRVCVGF